MPLFLALFLILLGFVTGYKAILPESRFVRMAIVFLPTIAIATLSIIIAHHTHYGIAFLSSAGLGAGIASRKR